MGKESWINKAKEFISWHFALQFILTPIAVSKYHFPDRKAKQAGIYRSADFLCVFVFGVQIARIQVGEWQQ
jgi:hypothetical protein